MSFGGAIIWLKAFMEKSEVKILHLTFNMEIGGTEQVIRQIVSSSNPDRFVHEIFCIDGRIGSLGQELQANGIHVGNFRRKPGFDINLIRSIHKLIRERKIDVLHCHQYTPYFYGVLGGLGTNVRIIFTEHGRFYPDRHHFKRRLINPLLVLRTANITAISRATADALAKYEYIGRKRIEVIYNGINILDDKNLVRDKLALEINLSPEYRYIGTISRLEPIKNQALMIDAFYRAVRIIPNLRLMMIGDGAKIHDLKQQVKALGIEKEVIFTGFMDNPQRFIYLFEIFLLSSFSEGTSMTLLEAMSLGKPCVVTDVGGNPEIVINNNTGKVVPSNDVDRFAESILELLTDDHKKKACGDAARLRYFRYFTASQMVGGYQNLYLGN